jgi:hypothetical protein
VRFGEKPPAGWTRINDSMFRVLQHSEEAKGMVLRGEYHMPPEAARVLNNYLAPGLRGNPLYDAFRGAGNMLNQSQLGFSAFHAMFADLEQRIKAAVIVPYDLDLCKEFGRVKLSLAAGRNVPANDLWIAACAIRHSIPLVTHNAKDFAGIPRLTVISESPRPAQARSGDLFKR